MNVQNSCNVQRTYMSLERVQNVYFAKNGEIDRNDFQMWYRKFMVTH